MTIGTRINNFDINRPPLAFGVRIDTREPDPIKAVTRIGDAEDMVVDTTPTTNTYTIIKSDFDNVMPWLGMERVSLNHNGDYMSKHGEVDGSGDSTFDESPNGEGKNMVRIPNFYIKIERNVPRQYEWQFWISPYPLYGFHLHPAFTRGSGTTTYVLDEIFLGAFEGYVDFSGSVPFLYSVAGVAPTTGYTRANYREWAGNVGTDCTRAGPVNTFNYGLMDWPTWNSVQLMALVEFATLDIQTPSGSKERGGLSRGITNDSILEKCGWTSGVDINENGFHSFDLGNRSGEVRCNINDFQQVYASSYHGLENVYGNSWDIVDAVVISMDDRRIWVNFTGSDLADQDVLGLPYIRTTYMSGESSGYIRALTGWDSYHEDEWMFAKYVLGGTASTFMCSTYAANAWPWTKHCYPRIGGTYNSGDTSGIFCTDVTFGYDDFDNFTGARLQYIPPDSSFYKY